MDKRMLMPDLENTLDWFQNTIQYGGETGDVFFLWVSYTHLELVIPNPIDIMYWRIESLIEAPDNNLLLDPKVSDGMIRKLFDQFMDVWENALDDIRTRRARIFPTEIGEGLLDFTAARGLDRTRVVIRKFESVRELEKALDVEFIGDLASIKEPRRGAISCQIKS